MVFNQFTSNFDFTEVCQRQNDKIRCAKTNLASPAAGRKLV